MNKKLMDIIKAILDKEVVDVKLELMSIKDIKRIEKNIKDIKFVCKFYLK